MPLKFRRSEEAPAGVGLPRRERAIAMAAILVNVALANLDNAIANTALPTIARDLNASEAQAIWVVSAYQIAMVATLLPAASLGEVLDLRRVSMAGLVLFTFASLLCGTAPSLEWLIVGRVLQGMSAASILGLSIAMTRSIYPSALMGAALGMNALVVGMSLAAGPTVASLILGIASWHWLFLINVPLGLIGIAAGLHSLPPTRRGTWRFDSSAALLCFVALAAGAYGLNALARNIDLILILSSAALAIVSTLLLVQRQKGHPAPILAVDLFRHPLFARALLASFLTVTTQALAFVSLPFLLQGLHGYSQVDTGFLITPWPVLVAATAPFAGRLSDRMASPVLGAAGTGVLALGLALLASLPAHASAAEIVWRMGICGIGYGLFQAPNVRTIIMSAPAERSGGAGGTSSVVVTSGHAIGAALVAFSFGAFGPGGAVLSLWLGVCLAMVSGAVCLVQLFHPLHRRRNRDLV